MIVVDEKSCTGCRACEFACSFQQKTCFHYDFSLIRIVKNKEMDGFFIPILCRHCDEMPCAEDCPTNAINRNGDSGVVTINRDKCTGCGICLDLCPWSAPNLDKEEGVAKICNLCLGDPLCVKFCNPGALRVT